MEKSFLSDLKISRLRTLNAKITRGISGVCPRCKKGNIYREDNDEYVCLQCGYRVNQATNEQKQIFKNGYQIDF
jgi:uncharacterized protein (DUF983 family)